jgi:hypothetical protein
VRFAGTLLLLLLDFLGDCFAGGGAAAAAPEGRLAGTGADFADRFDVEAVEAARIEWLRSAVSRHVANEGMLLLLLAVVVARHCHAVRGSGRAHAATKGEKAGRGFIAPVWMWIGLGIGG